MPQDIGRLRLQRNLIDGEGDISHLDLEGWTPLPIASRCGHLSVAKLLLEKVAIRGMNLLCIDTLPLAWLLLIVSMPLCKPFDAGADIDHINAEIYTPRMLASCFGKLDTIDVLVKHGALQS